MAPAEAAGSPAPNPYAQFFAPAPIATPADDAEPEPAPPAATPHASSPQPPPPAPADEEDYDPFA